MADKNRSLVMTFSNAKAEKRTVTINNPAEDLEGTVVSAQMDVLISSGILYHDTGVMTKKESAKFVVQTKTAVAVK